jgi:hypothetical protein
MKPTTMRGPVASLRPTSAAPMRRLASVHGNEKIALFLTAVLALAGVALASASTYSVTVAQANQTQAAGVFYMDGLNTHGYSGLAVIKDSMFLGNGMAGVHHFNSKSVTFHEDHLTIWGNGQATLAGVVMSDYNFQLSGPATTTNSIIQATVANQSFDPRATCPNAAGGPGEPCPMRYAIGDYYETANISNTDVYAPNGQYCWSYGRYGVCPTGLQYDVMFTGTVNVDPQFVNTAVVPSTAPDCSQKTSVIDCMAPVIAGFRAQNTIVAGMGYRPPGACVSDADWPTWIPVSLIPDGLVSKPCS